MRALRWMRTSRDRRPRPGRLTSLGPPEAAGRWSLVDPGWGGDGADAPAGTTRAAAGLAAETERRHATALALLERHGVLVREAVNAEGVDGGFSAVYPVLRAMEEQGRIRRGYVVDGLGGAQFALPGAIDRLRALREPQPLAEAHVHLLATADPANPYGASLPWPRRDTHDRRIFQRAAGAYVVLVDGAAVLYVDRGGSSIQLFPAADDEEVRAAAFRGLTALVADGRVRELVLAKVDGEASGTSPHRQALLDAGFLPGYRGLVLRSPGFERRSANGPFPPGPADPSLRRARPGAGPPDARMIRMGRG
jgi:ATP-dependent Lhr-like helicase